MCFSRKLQMSLSCIFTFCLFAGANASDEKLREAVLASIQEQRNILRDGLHVRYFVDRRLLQRIPPPWFVHVSGPKCDYSGSGRVFRAEHARKGDKFYAVTTLSKSASVQEDPGLRTRVFDGTRGFVLVHKTGTAHVHQSADRGGPNQYVVPSEDLYREIIGFEALGQGIQVTFRGPQNPFPYDLLEVLQSPKSRVARVEEKGRTMILVDTPNVDRIWLDTNHGYAILRREWRWDAGEPVKARIENSDLRQMRDSLWLPMTSRIRYYDRESSRPNDVVVDATLKVEHLSLDPPDKLFAPPIQGGTLVVDLEKDFHAVMPPIDEATLKRFLESPHETMEWLNERDKPGAFSGWRTVLIGANVLILAAILIYVLKRRYVHT